MASVTDIYNMALNLVGTRSDVTSPDEESREAEVCNRWYTQVRDQVFCAAHWDCADKTARMATLKTRDTSLAWASTDPPPRWIYAYQLPSDYLHAKQLFDFAPFDLGVLGNDRAIFTNSQTPIFQYSRKDVPTSLWDTLLTASVYYALAAHIAVPLTGSKRKGAQLLEEANRQIMMARQLQANKPMAPLETMPEWLTARGISGPSYPNYYIYPVGPLLTGTFA